MAIEAMEAHGLLQDKEYLRSPMCHRLVGTIHGTRILIRGFPELFEAVWHDMMVIHENTTNHTAERGKVKAQLQKALADRID